MNWITRQWSNRYLSHSQQKPNDGMRHPRVVHASISYQWELHPLRGFRRAKYHRALLLSKGDPPPLAPNRHLLYHGKGHEKQNTIRGIGQQETSRPGAMGRRPCLGVPATAY